MKLPCIEPKSVENRQVCRVPYTSKITQRALFQALSNNMLLKVQRNSIAKSKVSEKE
jgi:hypothetical protein